MIKLDTKYKYLTFVLAFSLPIISLYFDGMTSFMDKYTLQQNFPFHLKFFHFIIGISLILLILSNKKFYIDNIFFLLFLSLLFLLHAFYLGGITSRTIQQIIGLTIILIFINNYSKVINFNDFIDLYIKISKISSIIFICAYYVILISHKLEFIVLNGFDIIVNYFYSKLTLKGFNTEPQVFCLIILPSLGYLLFELKKNLLYILSISYCIILSNSATGIGMLFLIYMSCFIIKIFKAFNLKYFFIYIPIFFIVFILTLLLILRQEAIFIRLVEFSNYFFTIKFPDVHVDRLSNFILLKNLFLSIFVLQDNFLFGSGLGNHWQSIPKYYTLIENYEFWYDYRYFQDQDAASLGIRLISEFGFIGLSTIIAIIFFIIKSSKYYGFRYIFPSLIFFINVLIRNGNIVSLEFAMFIIFLLYSYFNEKKNRYISN